MSRIKITVLIAFFAVVALSASSLAGEISSSEYMPSFLKIEIINGIISKIEKEETGSRIIIDGKEYYFPNCYATPGMCDSHGHLISLGAALTEPYLNNTKSAEECLEIIKGKAPNRGNWLYGRGWNHEKWDLKEFPNKKALDSLFPDTPVCLRRVDGHAAWVNSAALAAAGIDNNTNQPQGGEILKDSLGETTGMLIDNAADMILSLLPDFSDVQLEFLYKIAAAELYKTGITEIHAFDISYKHLPVFKKISSMQKTGLRIQGYITGQGDEHVKFNVSQYKDDFLNIRGVKFYADGSLGSRGAALKSPYSDRPEASGALFFSENEFYEKIKRAVSLGFEVAVHCIGDSANTQVLKIFERINKEFPVRPVLRIEHCQVLSPSDVGRFVGIDALASMQPVHCPSDASMAEKRLGAERCSLMGYKWNTLLKRKTKLVAGSDFPIESHNPFTGIDAFVNRIPFGGAEPWFPEEALPLEEAVKAYTINPRKYLNINNRGILATGAQADIIIIDSDLTDKSKISATKVKMTIINGVIVWMSE